jgi:hypothetical protein
MNTARFASIAAFTFAIAVLVTPTALAQQRQGNGKKYVATRDITVDKQTGQLRRPTAEETEALVAQLTAMTNQSAEGLQQTSGTNGVFVDLQDRFQSTVLARPNPDGTSEMRCVTTFEEAAEFLGLVEAAGQQ